MSDVAKKYTFTKSSFVITQTGNIIMIQYMYIYKYIRYTSTYELGSKISQNSQNSSTAVMNTRSLFWILCQDLKI